MRSWRPWLRIVIGLTTQDTRAVIDIAKTVEGLKGVVAEPHSDRGEHRSSYFYPASPPSRRGFKGAPADSLAHDYTGSFQSSPVAPHGHARSEKHARKQPMTICGHVTRELLIRWSMVRVHHGSFKAPQKRGFLSGSRRKIGGPGWVRQDAHGQHGQHTPDATQASVVPAPTPKQITVACLMATTSLAGKGVPRTPPGYRRSSGLCAPG